MKHSTPLSNEETLEKYFRDEENIVKEIMDMLEKANISCETNYSDNMEKSRPNKRTATEDGTVGVQTTKKTKE